MLSGGRNSPGLGSVIRPERIDDGAPRIRFIKRLSIKSIWVELKWSSRPRELSIIGSSAMA